MSCAAHALAISRMFLTVEDVDLIRSFVAKLPKKPNIADIGAGSGTTALAILAENPDAHVVTIDISQENLDWAELVLKNEGLLTKNWVRVQGDSVESAGLSTDEYFHMILLDTSHEYEATKAEIGAWLPKLKPKGFFWFHDYIGSDVSKAVDDSVKLGLLQEVRQAGLGWAGIKP